MGWTIQLDNPSPDDIAEIDATPGLTRDGMYVHGEDNDLRREFFDFDSHDWWDATPFGAERGVMVRGYAKRTITTITQTGGTLDWRAGEVRRWVPFQISGGTITLNRRFNPHT